jgi:hypothetical protein
MHSLFALAENTTLIVRGFPRLGNNGRGQRSASHFFFARNTTLIMRRKLENFGDTRKGNGQLLIFSSQKKQRL